MKTTFETYPSSFFNSPKHDTYKLKLAVRNYVINYGSDDLTSLSLSATKIWL